MKKLALEAHPFYAARMETAGRPAPWTLDELEDFAATHADPFGGRLQRGAPAPPLAVQLEACDEPSLWVGLDARELGAWSRALAGAWQRWGLARGECIVLFDYGASPVVLLSSRSYTPHLRRGAADRLGVRVLCNDGLATLAERMVDVLEQLRPTALVARRDVLTPLAEAVALAGAEPARSLRWIAVSEPDGAPPVTGLRPIEDWGVPVHRILRSDAAFVLAGDCSGCGAFHLDPHLYRVEPLADGGVAVSARFARVCPALRHRLEGAAPAGGCCELEPDAARFTWR